MKVNALKCPICEDTVYSRATHDFRNCSCGSIAVDGGFDYMKICWDDNKIKKRPVSIEVEVDVSKKELYNDWNNFINKYGIIKSNKK